MIEFEKSRILRHRLIAGNFDRLIKQIDAGANSYSERADGFSDDMDALLTEHGVDD